MLPVLAGHPEHVAHGHHRAATSSSCLRPRLLLEPSPAGPPRSTYHLTPIGEEALSSSVDALRASVRAMETYLDRYVVARAETSATTQVVGPRPSHRRDP